MSKSESTDKRSKPKQPKPKGPKVQDFVVSQAFVVNEHLIDGPEDIDLFEDDQN